MKNSVLDSVYPALMPKGRIKASCKRDFLDLEICYYFRVENVGVAFITEGDIPENDIYEHAMQNSRKEIRIRRMSDILRLPEIPDWNVPVLVVSNESGFLGASAILHNDILYQLGNMLSEPFVLLPCSIHEMLAVPIPGACSVEDYRSIVRDVNGSDVISDNMFLSNSVYEYDGESFSIH